MLKGKFQVDKKRSVSHGSSKVCLIEEGKIKIYNLSDLSNVEQRIIDFVFSVKKVVKDLPNRKKKEAEGKNLCFYYYSNSSEKKVIALSGSTGSMGLYLKLKEDLREKEIQLCAPLIKERRSFFSGHVINETIGNPEIVQRELFKRFLREISNKKSGGYIFDLDSDVKEKFLNYYEEEYPEESCPYDDIEEISKLITEGEKEEVISKILNVVRSGNLESHPALNRVWNGFKKVGNALIIQNLACCAEDNLLDYLYDNTDVLISEGRHFIFNIRIDEMLKKENEIKINPPCYICDKTFISYLESLMQRNIIVKNYLDKGIINITDKIVWGENSTFLEYPILHYAASYCSEAVIKKAIEKAQRNNSDYLNTPDKNGSIPLHYAATRKNLEIIESLCKDREQANCRIINNSTYSNYALTEYTPDRTPLHNATSFSSLAVIRYLVNKGADVNAQDKDGWTPLHAACLRGDESIVNFLLEQTNIKVDVGCSLEGNNEKSLTPLSYLLMHNYSNSETREKIVKSLLQKGADIKQVFLICNDQEKRSPFDQLITCHDDIKLVELLVSELKNKLQQDDNLRKELFDSISKKLKDELPIPENVNDFMRILLGQHVLYAISWGRNKLTKFLLKEGANPNIPDKNNNAPLHFASKKGNLCIVKLLLEKGAIYNIKNNDNKTPLELTTDNSIGDLFNLVNELFENIKKGNHKQASECLRKEKAIVNARDDNGFTPLHIAAELGNFNVIKLLLKNGTVYNAENKDNRTPSELTTDKRIKDLFNLVEGIFKNIKRGNHQQASQCLKEEKAIVNARDSDGRTPLHWAVCKNDLDSVQTLLGKGADPTLVTNKGNTPLHMASNKGNTQAIVILLDHIKNNHPDKLDQFINTQTTAGETSALHVASDIKVARSLLQYGAVYNIKNREGKTPLDLTKNDDIRELLGFTKNLFKDVKNGNRQAISKLKLRILKKADDFIAVTHACNDQGHTLLQVAKHRDSDIATELSEMLKNPERAPSSSMESVNVARGEHLPMYDHSAAARKELYEKVRKSSSSNSPDFVEAILKKCDNLVSKGSIRYEDILGKLDRYKSKERVIQELENMIEMTVQEAPSAPSGMYFG